ncbi:hypothetical protein [Burkholderia cepacia]|uniref:hypothetical protein n=1 Tax=Burkholderia cepacia TaxID=292 RepID=UPI0018C6D0BC|nr:hypothetical protein [Burkholderia cepacia]
MVSHERHQHCGVDIEVGHPYERMPERVEGFAVIYYLVLVEIVGEPASGVFPVSVRPWFEFWKGLSRTALAQVFDIDQKAGFDNDPVKGNPALRVRILRFLDIEKPNAAFALQLVKSKARQRQQSSLPEVFHVQRALDLWPP